MDNVFKDYKCPICNGNLRIQEKEDNMGYYHITRQRLVCYHCKIYGGYGDLMDTRNPEERIIEDFEKAIERHKNKMLKSPEKILTDIRDYLVAKAELVRERDMEWLGQSAMLQLIAIEHKELKEYAEKLGVEL